MNTTFAILCRARAGRSLGVRYLVLVDRAKTRKLWWTSDDPDVVLQYRSEAAAKFACFRLKKNSPAVVPFETALKILNSQQESIDHNEAMAASEAGWDGHKGAFA